MFIFHDDCLNVIPGIAQKSINLVVADLPYGRTRCDWDKPIDIGLFWKAVKPVLVPGGVCILTAIEPYASTLRLSNPSWYKYDWVWEKTHGTGFLNAKKQPIRCHEYVLVFYRGRPTYNPQMTHGHIRKTATKRNDKTPVYGAQNGNHTYDSTDRYPRSVLVFPSDKQTSSLHPTQKPVALMSYLIRTYTNEGDTVLDPVMGSGTTGVAAVNTGREFIGIEKNKTFFSVAATRLGREVEATP